MSFRTLVSEALTWLGAHKIARVPSPGSIIMLHRVKPVDDRRWAADPGLWITDRQLRLLIRALRAQGYRLVSLDEALAVIEGRDPGPFACLTFDDGFRDFHDCALPVLADEQAPAALYVASGYVDRSAPAWECGVEAMVARGGTAVANLGDGERRFDLASDEEKRRAYAVLCLGLRGLAPAERTQALAELGRRNGIDFATVTDEAIADWQMLARLAESPWVTIGAHSDSHPALALLPAAQADAEIGTGKARLEQRLGRAVRHFAYPYGDAAAVNRETVSAAAHAGFASAVLAYGGPVRDSDGRFALPRIGFGGNDGLAALLLRMAGLGRAARPLHRTDLA